MCFILQYVHLTIMLKGAGDNRSTSLIISYLRGKGSIGNVVTIEYN